MDEAAQLSVVREFEGSGLGDVRRQGRMQTLVKSLAADPTASFPAATRTNAALEAAYRFLRNKSVTMEGILAGHYCQTVERVRSESVVLAIHDTTPFKFTGNRDGLGPLHGRGQGFQGHFSLLVRPGEARLPLGVIAVQTWVRPEGGQEMTETTGQSLEASRWKKGAAIAEKRIAGKCGVIHVMDREGDSYDLWAELMTAKSRFVIRNSRRRKLDNGEFLSDVIERGKTVVEREVQLSGRRAVNDLFNRRRNPARETRLAQLALSAQSVTLRRPLTCAQRLPETIQVNFVHVREIDTNGSEPPVDWVLATTEPIKTVADIERVVDIYRSRWVIEEFFKALRTGCGYEQRQLESEHTELGDHLVRIGASNSLVASRCVALRCVALRCVALRCDCNSAPKRNSSASVVLFNVARL
jgi:Transposase DNA-binding/Transposase DDE domain